MKVHASSQFPPWAFKPLIRLLFLSHFYPTEKAAPRGGGRVATRLCQWDISGATRMRTHVSVRGMPGSHGTRIEKSGHMAETI